MIIMKKVNEVFHLASEQLSEKLNKRFVKMTALLGVFLANTGCGTLPTFANPDRGLFEKVAITHGVLESSRNFERPSESDVEEIAQSKAGSMILESAHKHGISIKKEELRFMFIRSKNKGYAMDFNIVAESQAR